MNLGVYSVHDRSTRSYNSLFTTRFCRDAIRIFKSFASDPSSVIALSPDDFELVCVGSFNDETGVLTRIHPDSHVIVLGSDMETEPSIVDEFVSSHIE